MRRIVLVNGVPASGKSTVAEAVAGELGWPLLALDTIKEALFAHLGIGDRDYNRLLGKASYEAIFALIATFPQGSGAVVDAWFGFQPRAVLDAHLARVGAVRIAELWCHAPPETIGARYRARLADRHGGHLGEAYVPELIELAGRATPLGTFPMRAVDTTGPLDAKAIAGWLGSVVSA
jgi:glucokinase